MDSPSEPNQIANEGAATGQAAALAQPRRKPIIVSYDERLPPPRPGVRYVRLPRIGIVIADDDLRRRIDRRFHWPMIILALLSLPLLLLDLLFIYEPGFGGDLTATQGWIWMITLGGLTLVWLAFTLEFIVKIAIAECRIEYLRRNWLDVVIIVIPILRPLRAAAIARTTRVFTLRGVGFKFARYVFTIIVGLEATERFMHRLGFKPRVRRKNPEDMTRQELLVELRKLRDLSDRWDDWYATHREQIERLQPLDESPPPSAAEQSTVSEE